MALRRIVIDIETTDEPNMFDVAITADSATTWHQKISKGYTNYLVEVTIQDAVESFD
jgi:hypothetical protein